MIIAPGSLPIEDYHRSAPEWFSKTTLRLFDEMGAPWFKLWMDGKVQKPRPSGADQGRALDALLTEGLSALEAGFAFAPSGLDRRTKVGKEWEAQHDGKTILSEEDRLILNDAADAVRECSAWSAIENSLAQHTFRRKSSALGFGLQSRPDWFHLQSATMFDLKKTRDLDRFGSQAIELGYHLQAAVAQWCLGDDGIDMAGAFLVAAEWQRGARCVVYEIPSDVLNHADRQMRQIAQDIAGRIARNDWKHKRQEAATMLPVPVWMARKIESGEI